MFNCITNHFRKKKPETCKKNIHSLKRHNRKGRFFDEDSDVENNDDYMIKKSKINKEEAYPIESSKVEDWLSSSQNKFLDTSNGCFHNSACYTDTKTNRILKSYERSHLSNINSCSRNGEYFDCRKANLNNEYKNKVNIYNDSFNPLRGENIYENLRSNYKYNRIKHEKFDSQFENNINRKELTVSNKVKCLENTNKIVMNRESYSNDERDNDVNFFTNENNRSLESPCRHIHSLSNTSKNQNSIYKNKNSLDSFSSTEHFATKSSAILNTQHTRSPFKSKIYEVEKHFIKKDTTNLLNKNPQNKNSFSENLTSLISTILESGYISDTSKNHTSIKKQFQIEIELQGDNKTFQCKKSSLNRTKMEAGNDNCNMDADDSSTDFHTTRYKDPHKHNVANLILRITKVEGGRSKIDVETIQNMRSNKIKQKNSRHDDNPISILDISEIKSQEKPLNTKNNSTVNFSVVDSSKYENTILDKAFCLCEHESLNQSRIPNSRSQCLRMNGNETIEINRIKYNTKLNKFAMKKRGKTSLNKFHHYQRIINKYKNIRYRKYKNTLKDKQISNSSNLLDRSKFEMHETSREKSFTFTKKPNKKEKSNENIDSKVRKETFLRELEGLNLDSQTYPWMQESLTEEEKKIMMWIKETIRVVKLYVDKLKSGIISYSDSMKQILKAPVHTTVFRNMKEMLEISREFLNQLVSFYLNETCQSLQDILWQTVMNKKSIIEKYTKGLEMAIDSFESNTCTEINNDTLKDMENWISMPLEHWRMFYEMFHELSILLEENVKSKKNVKTLEDLGYSRRF